MSDFSFIDNNSNFLNDALGAFVRDRQEKRALDLERKKLDVVLERERLNKSDPQGQKVFNPSPGSLSDKPKTDAADQRGPTRFLESAEARWVIPLIIVFIGMMFIPFAKK